MRKAGLDKVKVIHGRVGEDSKQELVADLEIVLGRSHWFGYW